MTLGFSLTDALNGNIPAHDGDELAKYMVMASEEIQDSDIALQQGDTPIFSIGDISTITGLPKSRKTFLIASLATAFLKDGGFLSLGSALEKKRILIIDTEQSRRFVLMLTRRIYRLVGWDYSDDHRESMQILTLRELTPENRYMVLTKAINRLKPQLVFIDGSADLIEDTNNVEQSNELVNNLMRLSSEKQCHICSVVHTNPNSEKTRGHFGSELQRKSETVILVQRDGDTTTIKPQFCRSLEFSPFSFVLNEKGLPEQTEAVQPKQENLQAVFAEVYAYAEYLSYTDLRERLMANLNKGKTACENKIKKATTEKILYKDIDGNYRLFTEPTETDLPFEENEILPF